MLYYLVMHVMAYWGNANAVGHTTQQSLICHGVHCRFAAAFTLHFLAMPDGTVLWVSVM